MMNSPTPIRGSSEVDGKSDEVVRQESARTVAISQVAE
jgi:hypothetical protein